MSTHIRNVLKLYGKKNALIVYAWSNCCPIRSETTKLFGMETKIFDFSRNSMTSLVYSVF
jgi:hypothetical protein